MFSQIFLFVFFFVLAACTPQSPRSSENTQKDAHKDAQTRPFYSLTGQEYQVRFQALYESSAKSLDEITPSTLPYRIRSTTKFLAGPLGHRQLGGVQKGERITPHLEEAYVEEGHVLVPYTYEAQWVLENNALASGPLYLPLPYSVAGLETPHWKSCTDDEEDHNTWDFFWYFWDPERPGCDHEVGVNYQEVEVLVTASTTQTRLSYPEYSRLIHDKDGVPTLAMTFAFGYVKENSNPDPFRDIDYGIRQFQRFYAETKNTLLALGFEETPIFQSDISEGNQKIGAKFIGSKNGVRMEVSVVAAAGVDQMDLFAHSYARDHEGFFGWFGHSRVGSGFDAEVFESKLKDFPEDFSLTQDYQLIYWAGCNSYSYYTKPFFELKAELDPTGDPEGTRHLDIIANTLPSYFAFNGPNAKVLFNTLLHWDSPTSYQEIVRQIEDIAGNSRAQVIVTVLGDEDNEP